MTSASIGMAAPAPILVRLSHRVRAGGPSDPRHSPAVCSRRDLRFPGSQSHRQQPVPGVRKPNGHSAIGSRPGYPYGDTSRSSATPRERRWCRWVPQPLDFVKTSRTDVDGRGTRLPRRHWLCRRSAIGLFTWQMDLRLHAMELYVCQVPMFIDRHDAPGVTPEDLANAHRLDVGSRTSME